MGECMVTRLAAAIVNRSHPIANRAAIGSVYNSVIPISMTQRIVLAVAGTIPGHSARFLAAI
jgi:hypothetical protein